jgi:hypothetical protein
MRKKRFIIPFLLVAGLAAAGLLLGLLVLDVQASPDATSPNFSLTWEVIASGGSVMTSANYIASQTVGQPVIGQVSSANYRLQSGYWVAISDFFHRVFLPFLTRN